MSDKRETMCVKTTIISSFVLK